MLDKIIKARKSVKKFSSRKPDWRTIIECVDLARFAPMAGNNFSLKFILVGDPEKIQQIAEASEQEFIGEAHYIVVFCSDPKRTINLYEKRGEKYLHQQAGAGIQNFLLKLTEAKLDTCWVGHFNDRKLKHILEIPDDINIEALFPIGYAYKKSEPKRKIDLDNVLYFNKYKQKQMNPKRKLSA